MSQPLRVLLVDDNRSDRVLVIRELQREFEQVQVQEITDAHAFNQAIVANGFDAVITDYQLGWTNGIDILHSIKAQYPTCPVIMFTNSGSEEIAVEAMKSGLDDYVLKTPNRYIRVPVSLQIALERSESQKRAALTDLRLQSLLNQLKIGVFRAQPSGVLLDANPALLELSGIDVERDAERDMERNAGDGALAAAQILLQPYLQSIYQRLTALPTDRSPEQEIEFRRLDGSTIWLSLSLTLNSIGGVEVVDGLLENITDRKRVELELQQLNQELEQRVRIRTAELESANQGLERSNRDLEEFAERLRAANQNLEEFAYSVSHDLRAPLRAIEGFARIVLHESQTPLNSETIEYLERIAVNANQANTLITNLLTYSQLGQGDIFYHPVNLSRALDAVLQQLNPEIQQRQAQITVEQPLPKVMGNFQILIQVLINLLSNAMKFVAPAQQPQVHIWAEPRNGQIRLWIEDAGIGIAPADQQRIFRAFERLHGMEDYPGTGVGLAIVQRGVARMGGQVGLESQLGQGSRFWMELPAAAAEEQRILSE